MVRQAGKYIASHGDLYIHAASALSRARRENIPTEFKSIPEFAVYLETIIPKRCPVFGFKFARNTGAPGHNSISIDRINPKKGYTKDNIQIISMLANRMKHHATSKQLSQFADWVLTNC
jgi:hypothetical protein